MRSRIVLALALLGSLSCSGGPGRIFAPPPVRDIRIAMAVEASPTNGSPTRPVTIAATVQNFGRQVQIRDDCTVPLIRLYDAQGDELHLSDPRVVSICIRADPYLHVGQRLVLKVTFDSHYYGLDGSHLEAPAGTYRAVARFAYFGDSGSETLEREVAFTWQ
jgi:hypothetical protein